MTEQPTIEPADVRSAVIDRYSGLARIAMAGGTPVDCGPAGSGDACFAAAAYDDADVPQEALRASLGCGNPLAVAQLEPGEVVLDLGSGGGLDVLLSARRVGASGTVYGLDASPDMIRLAQGHAEQARASNVAFLQGAIEDIPLPDNHVDVIISNCVINLSADKPAVLAEAFRVLRPGGRLGISDVTAEHGLDLAQRTVAEQRVGCSVGTLTEAEYRTLLASAGFVQARITPTNDAGGGLSSTIIQAVKPATPGTDR
ncbi:MAG: arsenite S-adenosylmethyltransferase [Pseudonocardiales bacterium]|nr:MAG: arsenite S-adenosylmethyltransferase [Pseudonocardiales bacterium]